MQYRIEPGCYDVNDSFVCLLIGAINDSGVKKLNAQLVEFSSIQLKK